MSDASTTIAQLLYTKRPPMNFAHVVRELDAALLRCPADRRSLSWDCDDVAVFDLDAARIALGYADDLPGGYRACLSISVGHGPTASYTPPLLRRRQSLCRLILDRIAGRYPADDVVWHEQEEVTTAETIDRLLDRLPAPEIAAPTAAEFDRLMARLDEELRQREPEHDTELLIEAPVEPTGADAPGFWSALLDTDIAQRAFAMARQKSEAAAAARSHPVPVPDIAVRAEPEMAETAIAVATVPVVAQTATVPTALAANDSPDLPLPMAGELARLRAALYPEEPEMVVEETERPTTAMRLAVHAMNATLITVYAPVGAAVMTYSILKGEDMRLSGRMMALAGAFLALTNTPMAHQVMAVIGT